MSKTAFIGFGEVNTPIDIIIDKCKKAEEGLKKLRFRIGNECSCILMAVSEV